MLRVYLSLSVILVMVRSEITDFYPNVKKNLTAVTWEHAVNNATFLNKTLARGDVMMIEADVVMGTLPHGQKRIPVMAHPPKTVSDISLEQFIANVTVYNKKNPKHIKGIKLDFKSIDAFTAAVPLIPKNFTEKNVLWLNADILKGPVNATSIPVDAMAFLSDCKKFNSDNTTLSLGWTTEYSDKTKNGSYNQTQIKEMINVVKEYRKYNLTFPVRAVYAENSAALMRQLVKEGKGTLTVWTGVNDTVDLKKLESLVKTVGLEKVYLDIPMDMKKKMNLNSGSSRITIGLVTIVATIFFSLLYNQMIN